MPHCSHVVAVVSFVNPECCMTKLVSSSLIGMWLLTGSPSFCAAHCSQRCFSIFLPPLISVRGTVAVLLQLSHFIDVPHGGARSWTGGAHIPFSSSASTPGSAAAAPAACGSRWDLRR